ncbi:MAG: zf-TFIIB domain-containing protein [Deltaproteobacteria bacterium]|nr:zf-TFIIB domain-containing protein [Deltaproteobacteria bacterium]
MTETRKLICPECNGPLHEVFAEANYGRVLLLDQCKVCGGVWFDRWELYFVTDRSIKDLEALDAASFAARNPVDGGKGLCPRCEKELAVFIDPNLPKDALIERCKGCNGLWLNRGELKRFAAHRKTFRASRPEYSNAASEIGALKNLQKELKLGNLAVPTTLELASNLQNEPPVNSKEVAKDLAFLALQSLVRLVFKF